MAPMMAQYWHDPILHKDYLSINATGAYALSERLTLALSFGFIPVGINVSNAKLISLTLLWLIPTKS